MNRYRFRLETVLRYRRIMEDNRKRALADALHALRSEEDTYIAITREIDDQDNRSTVLKQRTVHSHELVRHAHYAHHLDRRKKKQAVRISEAGTVVDGKRSELAEAMKERKILDRLKERGREEHERETAKEEQNMVDDLMVQRFNSKHTE